MDRGKISKNFSWYEFFRSYVAIRKGINNTPHSPFVYENIERLTKNILQPLRDVFGPIYISSGYRNPELNDAVGGHKYSNHTIGCAADIEPLKRNVSLMDILEWIHKNCSYRELIAEYFPDGWVHVAYKEGYNNRQLKLRDAGHFYTPVSLVYLKEVYGETNEISETSEKEEL